VNLDYEEQVDLIMRRLPDLEYLNGLKVERDLIARSDAASPQSFSYLGTAEKHVTVV
jgi:hypothetical protein